MCPSSMKYLIINKGIFHFVAKSDTVETKLETITEIQEEKDEGQTVVSATYLKISSLLDIVIGTYINHQFKMKQCTVQKCYHTSSERNK